METLSPKKSFSRLGLALFVVLAVTTLLQLLFSVLANLLTGGELPSWAVWLGNFLPLYAVAIPIGVAVMKKVPVRPAEASALGTGRFFRVLVVCFPIMYIGNLIGTLLSSLLSGGQASNPLVTMTGSGESWLRLLVIPVLAPLFEEFLFRRQLIGRCVKYGEKTAMVYSALCFALFHMNLFQFFYAFGLGLVFAYVYIRTRRLRYSVILHMIVNFIGSVLAPWLLEKSNYAALTQADPADAAQLAGAVTPWTVVFMLYALALVALSVIGIVILVKSRRKLVFLPAEEELEPQDRFRTMYLNAGFILFFLLCAAVIVVNLLGL